jgi:hypothetical protein
MGQSIDNAIVELAAVEAVICEPVSDRPFLVQRENTGNSPLIQPRERIRLCFPRYKSVCYGEIPYAEEQGIFSREQRISPPYQGMPHEHEGCCHIKSG